MKVYFPSQGILRLLSFVFAILVVISATSCSKDSIPDTIENEDASDPETDDGSGDDGADDDGGNDDDGNNDDGDDDSNDDNSDQLVDIVFEEGIVLDAGRSFVNFVLSENAYNEFITGDGDLKAISEKMYEYLNDDYDFIVILSVEDEQPEDLFFGRSTLVQNLVQGIGGGVYNLSSTYGSAGKLKSVIYMPRSEYVRSGPFLHEIAHTWANKGFIPTTVAGHWGYSSAGGQLGGFDELIVNGDGTYMGRLNNKDGFGANANGGNSIPYSNIELYVMGLIPATDLESIMVAVNPVAGSAFGAFSADSIEEHTKSMLVAANSPRLPSSADSQKDFKALTVVISKTAIDATKKSEINVALENFSRQAEPDWNGSYNFYTATQGKASFSFELTDESIK